MRMPEGAHPVEIGADDAEPPPGPDGAVQRATGSEWSGPGAELGEGVAHAGRQPGEAGERPHPGGRRLLRQPAPARLRPGERPRRRAGHAIDEGGEDGQPADPVGEHVVEHDHQGTAIAREAGDEGGRPQRPVGREPAGHGLRCDTEEGVLVAGRRAADRRRGARCRTARRRSTPGGRSPTASPRVIGAGGERHGSDRRARRGPPPRPGLHRVRAPGRRRPAPAPGPHRRPAPSCRSRSPARPGPRRQHEEAPRHKHRRSGRVRPRAGWTARR